MIAVAMLMASGYVDAARGQSPPSIPNVELRKAGANGSLYAGVSDWTNVGPEGGSFWQLVVDPQNPDIIYATTGAGLFKSQNGGANWDNSGLNGFAVYALMIDPQQPNILYAAATNSRLEEDTLVNVFKSTDGWSLLERVGLRSAGLLRGTAGD
jgi:hypothetical protein